MRRVIIESPYAGNVELNLQYLRACMHDSIANHGEAPYASHGLYTQPGVLDDTKPDERKLGIESGFAWRDIADATVVYHDLGVTSGMRYGIDHARSSGKPLEFRLLGGRWIGVDASSKAATPPAAPTVIADACLGLQVTDACLELHALLRGFSCDPRQTLSTDPSRPEELYTYLVTRRRYWQVKPVDRSAVQAADMRFDEAVLGLVNAAIYEYDVHALRGRSV